MKTSWIFLPISIMLIIIFGCEAQEVPDTNPNPSIMSEAYEPCCGLDTVTYRLGDEWIAMPNVFTPNGDGVNDIYYPIVSNDSIIIYNYTLFGFDSLGVNRTLFSRQVFSHNKLDLYGWKGKWEGLQFKGKFTYYFVALYREHKLIIDGSSCAIICDNEAPIFKDKSGCFFQSQLTSNGNFDDNLPKNEVGCFE